MQNSSGKGKFSVAHVFNGFLVPRAYSVIMFAALICTLAVKLFDSNRCGLLDHYLSLILADVSFYLGVEVIMALICSRWADKRVVRTVTVVAGVICTWSVLNAGWLIRTGTQILPRVLLPLFRAPIHCFWIVSVNLVKMPVAAIVLLVPSAAALAFFFYVLSKPKLPLYNKKRFAVRVTLSVLIVFSAAVMRPILQRRGSSHIASKDLKHNSQIKAIVSLVRRDYGKMLAEPKRKIPLSGQIEFANRLAGTNLNVIVVVLEGVQYNYTSLAGLHGNLTPHLSSFANQGIEFANARSSLSHTTKALFALLTGRYPSASQDIAEAVPVDKPYASIATILSNNLNYRTAFFQSAMGGFESRPGLVANLGFDTFWSRDDLNDPNDYIGYLACDEFSTLEPVTSWIKADERPFFLTFLCSVTHDPYEVPEWYGTREKEPIERYKQAISYTDKFLEALDVALNEMNIADETIFCVVGDHGEAFGEHGQHGHALIAFDEVLRIPFCLRAPFFIEPGTKINEPVSSVDLAPTLLSLLGLETEKALFDGIDLLREIPDDRKVYFSGWMQEGPAGYVQGDRKIIYDSTNRNTYFYRLSSDPTEVVRIELAEEKVSKINEQIISWRSGTILKIAQMRNGKKLLYDNWLCSWTDNRTSKAKYIRGKKENSHN